MEQKKNPKKRKKPKETDRQVQEKTSAKSPGNGLKASGRTFWYVLQMANARFAFVR
jgi:hypothetical protein